VRFDASLLDGLSQPKQIVKRIQEINSNACALTDHGSIGNCVKFLQAMTDAKKKPILGCELYISEFDASIHNDQNRSLSHLLVYAKNDDGWVSLMELISEANLVENFYYKPRLTIDQLAKYAGNIMVATGHLGSTLANTVMEDDVLYDDAVDRGTAHITTLQDAFGKDNVWLECQLIDKKNIPQMEVLTNLMRGLSITTGAECIAVPDAHYCRREDAPDQRILLCRSLNITLQEASKGEIMGAFFKSSNFHIPTYEDMVSVGHSEKELENTNNFAEMCDIYTRILKAPILPTFPCPEGYTPDEWLRELCRKGWMDKIEDKINKPKHTIYAEQVKHELEVLQGAGLSSYFLIVRDIIQYIIAQGWLPGPGRGSAAGCLVSYLVDITQIDPIEYDLIFERFYSAGRNVPTHINFEEFQFSKFDSGV